VLRACTELGVPPINTEDRSKRGAASWRTIVKRHAKAANRERRDRLFQDPPSTLLILAELRDTLTGRYRLRHILRETAAGPSSLLVGLLGDNARMAPKTRSRWGRDAPEEGSCDLCGRYEVEGGGPHVFGTCASVDLAPVRRLWRSRADKAAEQ